MNSLTLDQGVQLWRLLTEDSELRAVVSVLVPELEVYLRDPQLLSLTLTARQRPANDPERDPGGLVAGFLRAWADSMGKWPGEPDPAE